MRFGLEIEWFLRQDGQLRKVDKKLFPYDECGYLVEARGKPADSIRDAVFMLRAEMFSLEKLAQHNNYSLDLSPLALVPKQILSSIRREFAKGTVHYENLYGYESHKNGNLATAGLHISFTVPQIVYHDKGSTTVNTIWDFAKLFRYLDTEFKREIDTAKRRPGFYELKPDGRIEYRSLPNNVSLDKVIEVIDSYK